MRCSVVIPALNDDEALAQLMPRLNGYEIVVDDTLGLARAIKKGIERAKGDMVAVMDCDGYQPPEMLPDIFRMLEGCDLVYASRDTWPMGLHGLFTNLGNAAARLALRLNVRDITGGYWAAWKRRLLELPDSVWTGYGDYTISMLSEAKRRQWNVALTSFTPGQRTVGDSHTRVFHHSLQYIMRIGRESLR